MKTKCLLCQCQGLTFHFCLHSNFRNVSIHSITDFLYFNELSKDSRYYECFLRIYQLRYYVHYGSCCKSSTDPHSPGCAGKSSVFPIKSLILVPQTSVLHVGIRP